MPKEKKPVEKPEIRIGPIEDGIEPPEARSFRSNRSELRDQIEVMYVGESFLIEAPDAITLERHRRIISGMVTAVSKKFGRKYVMRMTGPLEIRVFRLS